MSALNIFNFQHILYTVIGTVGTIGVIFLSKAYPNIVPKVVGILIFLVKLSELTYRHLHWGEPIKGLLPLHLCNITLIFSVLVLVFRMDFLFEPMYYWGIGAIFAIILPDTKYGYRNFATISFFVTHFFLLYSLLCCVLFFKLKPTLKGYWRSYIVINILALIVFFINRGLGTNYMYLNGIRRSPVELPIFLQWPYYIIILEVMYVIVTYLIYLPFKKENTISIN